MTELKERLLYDATFLAECVEPKSRTGIYFVAYNVLKKMLEKNLYSIDLFCKSSQLKNLQTLLDEVFPNLEFNIMTELNSLKLAMFRASLKEKREL